MLIGIHGKIGAGKDTLAKMIQLVIYNNVYINKGEFAKPTKETLDNISALYKRDIVNKLFFGGWEIKKFADALKDIVCILIGCRREQLEDADFKNSTLHSSWAENIQGTDIIGYKIMTVRTLLQRLGTDVMRKYLHDQVWVNALFSKYTPESKWLITDVRFPNEVKAIKNKSGLVLKIVGNFDNTDHDHISETALDSYTDWDCTIYNHGSLEDLYDIAKELVTEHKLT